MTSTISSDSDPFADPGVAEGVVDTLNAGRNASLTLATDSLIVLDEGFTTREPTNCCGLIPSSAKTTKAIPFFNVLWAQLSEFDITIHYAHAASKHMVRVAFVNYTIEKLDRKHANAWISKLLDRAYGESQRNKRIKVLINPFGGNGSAQKWYVRDVEPIFAAAHCDVDVERTQFKGHAVEIAEKLDTDAYDVIASCSGDGLPHEVFNGLGRKRDAREALSKVAVVQLPCGTGNAMSWNLNGTGSNSMAALCTVKGIRTPLDLVSITQGDRRTLSFLSQSAGIVAESDLGTENLRWMGSARFTYGFLVRLLRQTLYPCDLAVKVDIPDKAAIREHYRTELGNHAKIDDRRERPIGQEADGSSYSREGDGLPSLKYGSINDDLPAGWNLVPYDKLGNFYAGNMAYMASDANFFPAALPSDGHLDLVTIDGDISRSAAIQSLLAVEKGTFFDMPHVKYRKISAYRIIPKGQRDGYISIDGERVPFEPFQAEVHRGLGTVLSRSGHVYEAQGVCAQSGYSDSA
ncbi:MAG: sphingosine kinase [Lasallia pustulata]|uniref:Sphingosine kinase n=1 Tax=Lasallia pustulata TaxID=136370 RepID=A0A5M8PQC8_9LECA|nr:MAG: sphingosine kinase [Lasallia pustulata]